MHIETSDNVLEIVAGLLNDAKTIAFDDNPAMRANLAQEVAAIREQILELANTKLDGDYIFAGDVTDTQPFDAAGTYFGDNGNKALIAGSGTQVNIATDGFDIFQSVTDIFTELTDLQTDLLAGVSADITSHIDPLEQAMDQVNAVRAENASAYKRLEATENHYRYFKVNMQELLSKTEDADLAEAIVSFQAQQTTYESTLATSSMIMQKSLIDFLR
jgi:flagellar hook-associated protein 3 FlgL